MWHPKGTHAPLEAAEKRVVTQLKGPSSLGLWTGGPQPKSESLYADRPGAESRDLRRREVGDRRFHLGGPTIGEPNDWCVCVCVCVCSWGALFGLVFKGNRKNKHYFFFWPLKKATPIFRKPQNLGGGVPDTHNMVDFLWLPFKHKDMDTPPEKRRRREKSSESRLPKYIQVTQMLRSRVPQNV